MGSPYRRPRKAGAAATRGRGRGRGRGGRRQRALRAQTAPPPVDAAGHGGKGSTLGAYCPRASTTRPSQHAAAAGQVWVCRQCGARVEPHGPDSTAAEPAAEVAPVPAGSEKDVFGGDGAGSGNIAASSLGSLGALVLSDGPSVVGALGTTGAGDEDDSAMSDVDDVSTTLSDGLAHASIVSRDGPPATPGAIARWLDPWPDRCCDCDTFVAPSSFPPGFAPRHELCLDSAMAEVRAVSRAWPCTACRLTVVAGALVCRHRTRPAAPPMPWPGGQASRRTPCSARPSRYGWREAVRRGCHGACRVVDGAGLAQGTVDYVWYTPRTLRVCAVLELVDIAELKRWKLPSKCVGGKAAVAAASPRPSQRVVPLVLIVQELA